MTTPAKIEALAQAVERFVEHDGAMPTDIAGYNVWVAQWERLLAKLRRAARDYRTESV